MRERRRIVTDDRTRSSLLRLARLATEEAVTLIEAGRPALDQAFRYLYGKDAVYEELVRRVEKGQALIERAISSKAWIPSTRMPCRTQSSMTRLTDDIRALRLP